MTTRTDEIRKQLQTWKRGDIVPTNFAPVDIEYLLARVAKLEGLLREVRTCGGESAWDVLYPETSDRVDAALGEP